MAENYSARMSNEGVRNRVRGRSNKPLISHGGDDPERRLNGNAEPACLVIWIIVFTVV